MWKTPEFWVALGVCALTVSIVVLRFVAPRTATKADDRVLEELETVADFTGHPVAKEPPEK